MLHDTPIIGFVPSRDASASRHFYEKVLGLTFLSDDGFALVFQNAAGSMIRIARVGDFTPAPFTVLGWEIKAIEEKAGQLADLGVTAIRHTFLQQDALGVWTAPGGDKVLWFNDPDGNVLSLSEHVARR